MYGRSGDGYGYMGRERSSGIYGYDRGPDSYWSPPEPLMSPYDGPDRGSSYYDQPKRSRYGYSEPERGYRGRKNQRPPHHAPSWGRGDPRGSFRGNFGPTRPVRGARHLNQPPIPEMDQFQQLKPFVDNFYYGGGFRPKSEAWNGEQNKESKGGEPPAKKMKTTAENSKSEKAGSEGGGDAEEPANSAMSDGDREDGTQEETEHTQSSSKKHQETQKEILDQNLLKNIQFFCTLCKFRTFFEEEWIIHHQSRFHKDHFQNISRKLPKQKADFLEAFMTYNYKSAIQKREQVEDLDTKILQIYRNQDLTLGLGMEHFVKKVEVTHCGACDIFLPMNSSILQKHIESPSHKNKCKRKMRISQSLAAIKAKSILRDKRNERLLEQYTNGQNPIIIDDEENIRSGCSKDLAPEGEESGDMPCITLSDSEGEEDDFQGQTPFIIDDDEEEEKDDTRSNCSTELVPEAEESQQRPCSPLPDSERDEEKDSGGQVTEQETACKSL